jgi:hypothetical protein
MTDVEVVQDVSELTCDENGTASAVFVDFYCSGNFRPTFITNIYPFTYCMNISKKNGCGMQCTVV